VTDSTLSSGNSCSQIRVMERAKSSQDTSKIGAFEIHWQKFQPVGLCAAEGFDCEREPLFEMIGNGEHAAGQIVSFGPQVQQGLFILPTNFPGQCEEWSDAGTLFPGAQQDQRQQTREEKLPARLEVASHYYNDIRIK
jgi:hypothetical protein